MTMQNYKLFDTAIGRCGIAWGALGITGVQLPQPTETQTRQRLIERSGGEAIETDAPMQVATVIGDIVQLMDGQSRDLSAAPLDMTRISAFQRNVYDIARTIRPGATLTYGDIARRLGDVALSREVGQALGHNPYPIIVPCHRVLAAGDRPGGFSANGGVMTKLRMLAIEGAYVNCTPSLFDNLQ
jgi:methylated-DNA-[protein]-cysteine S-methyltransferase